MTITDFLHKWSDVAVHEEMEADLEAVIDEYAEDELPLNITLLAD